VLQPTYRIERNRPVVMIFGKLESGEPFLIRETRAAPFFNIKCEDAERARTLGAEIHGDDPPRRTLLGETTVRVVLRLPSDAPPLRDRLSSAGIDCFEADIRFAYRYLIERGIRATLEIRGNRSLRPGLGWVFENPDVRPSSWTPSLSVLSIDIETDPSAGRLLSVALHGCDTSEVLLLNPPGYLCPPNATGYSTERDLMGTLAQRVRQLDPDVITGWNVIDFDIAVLLRIAGTLGVPFEIGRGPGSVRLREASSPRGSGQVSIPGRVVLDGIQLLRGAFVKVQRYGLDAVAHELLGRGKTIGGHDRAEAILEAFEHDRRHLAEYNLNDARLVTEILDHLQLIELTIQRCRLTGMPPDRVAASIASFDFLYLSQLGPRQIVAPTVGAGPKSEIQALGGHVLDPTPGIYPNVWVFDFKSLYPSVIRTFEIDPLGLVRDPRPGGDFIRAPNGAAFRREKGILPAILDELFPRREAAKAAGNSVASQAIKILMNSFYGVLGSSACRFADPLLANAITGFGREMLLWTKARFEERGYKVLYGDTDSLFVRAGTDDPAIAQAAGMRLADEINEDLAEHVRRNWRVESRLELEFERLYLRLLLPTARGKTEGARKRYAGLIDDDGARRVVFTGMEVVRRDWTELAKRVQRELYERLFSDRPVDEYVRNVVRDLRHGEFDDQLVYSKALRKAIDDYTASTPPHVAAARKMTGPPGRIVDYFITHDGPEPRDERHSPIDHEHYVQKQLRAVAEPVLNLLGLEFDRVVGDDAQLRLF